MARKPKRDGYFDPETLEKIGSVSLAARQIVEGLRVGAHRSPLRGFSTEFAHHRPYVFGDDTRHIDWRVYGRTERYYIKLYEAETNYDAVLLLDASSSMRYGSGPLTKLEYAKYMAASLAWLVSQSHDSVGLATFDSQLRTYIEPGSTRLVLGRMEQELLNTRDEPRTDIAALLHDFAERLGRRSFVMLFSDLFEEPARLVEGLDHLRFRGHNLSVFHILDPDELRFPFSGTCRFLGLEGEPEITTQPRRVQQDYIREIEGWTREIRRACEQRHADYLRVDVSRSLDTVLLSYLIGRSGTVGTANR